MDKYEWLEGLGCLFHVAILMTIAGIWVAIVAWITSVFF